MSSQSLGFPSSTILTNRLTATQNEFQKAKKTCSASEALAQFSSELVEDRCPSDSFDQRWHAIYKPFR